MIIVGAQDPDLIRSAKFQAAPTMGAAFAMAGAALGPDLDAVIVPRATLTLPIVGGTSFESAPSSVLARESAGRADC